MSIFSGCYHGKSLSTVLKSSSLLQECQNKALYSQTSAFKDRLGWLCHCLQPPRVTKDGWQSWETDWELARVGWSAHTKTCLQWYTLHWELPDHACSLKNQCDLFLDLTAEHREAKCYLSAPDRRQVTWRRFKPSPLLTRSKRQRHIHTNHCRKKHLMQPRQQISSILLMRGNLIAVYCPKMKIKQ